ncbi:MAG: hypothetical protein HY737_01945 [Candidatus Omnitrophica bacterium]|nr:hypothetical protein [Candidatus Omnitrophota bacterium]
MNTKLTLKLDGSAIQRAKRYAHSYHISLSRIVEDYFQALGSKSWPPSERLTPLVRELSGVTTAKAARRWREAYAEHLAKKYAR